MSHKEDERTEEPRTEHIKFHPSKHNIAKRKKRKKQNVCVQQIVEMENKKKN